MDRRDLRAKLHTRLALLSSSFAVNNWLDQLRFDIERAEVVVFLGFSAADFHLNQVFFNATGLREKAFFINRPAPDPDPDEGTVQEDFGEPLYIGREDFAQIVVQTLKQQVPLEPKLASFRRYQAPPPSTSVPAVLDIENLFIWGAVVGGHLKRDQDLQKSDYHVLRSEPQIILEHLKIDGSVVFLHGDICDGKTLIVLGAMNALSAGRPVFELLHAYVDLLDETSAILLAYPTAVLVVENCLSLREDRLLGLARLISGSAGGLILAARSISTEAESGKIKGLRTISSLLDVGVGSLRPDESGALLALVDQIAGWRDFRTLSPGERRRFIEKDCQGVIPNVLLRLLNSRYVRDRYREEFNKTGDLDPRDRQMVISALLIANIGFDPPLSFLSDIFEQDFGAALKRISNQSDGLRLLRTDGSVVRTIPSIGARNLLKTVVEEREIVNSTIFILEKMAREVRRSDFQQHMFSQLMRYSILSSTVEEHDEINRFFDHICKIAHFRDMPLFWLQWHMAMCAQSKWLKADEYLSMSYTAATAYEKRRAEKYNRKQLDDRKAKFLAARAESMMRSGVELFRDMKEAIDLVGRLMRDTDLSHHPYETLSEISKVLSSRGSTLIGEQRRLLVGQFGGVVDQARQRLGVVPDGYQRSHALEYINQIDATTTV